MLERMYNVPVLPERVFSEARKMNCYTLTNSPISNLSRAHYYMKPSRKHCKLWTKKISGSVKLYINDSWGIPVYLWTCSHFSIFFIMANQCQYFVSVDTRKTRDQIFGTVGNLKIVCTMHIYKMVAVFWFFHNDWCQYYVSVNTQRMRDPNSDCCWRFIYLTKQHT